MTKLKDYENFRALYKARAGEELDCEFFLDLLNPLITKKLNDLFTNKFSSWTLLELFELRMALRDATAVEPPPDISFTPVAEPELAVVSQRKKKKPKRK